MALRDNFRRRSRRDPLIARGSLTSGSVRLFSLKRVARFANIYFFGARTDFRIHFFVDFTRVQSELQQKVLHFKFVGRGIVLARSNSAKSQFSVGTSNQRSKKESA